MKAKPTPPEHPSIPTAEQSRAAYNLAVPVAVTGQHDELLSAIVARLAKAVDPRCRPTRHLKFVIDGLLPQSVQMVSDDLTKLGYKVNYDCEFLNVKF